MRGFSLTEVENRPECFGRDSKSCLVSMTRTDKAAGTGSLAKSVPPQRRKFTVTVKTAVATLDILRVAA